MSEAYVVEVKHSARHEWTISDDMYDENHCMRFNSQNEAEDWVDEHNTSTPSFGSFFLRDADSEDESEANSYLLYRKPDLCDGIEDRDTSVVVTGHEIRSGTLFINEATQELFTFAYAVNDMAVCIAHGGTQCDPKGIITIDLDTFEKKSRLFRALDIPS